MPAKGFKSSGIAAPRSADDVFQAASPLLGSLPAATPQAGITATDAEEVVQINIRVRRSLADALADAADDKGTTQKAIICEALRDAGFAVHPEDLGDRSGRRRRGTRR
jgi:hypothetical protein